MFDVGTVVVLSIYRRDEPAGDAGTTTANGTTLLIANTSCSHPCQVMSQALWRATGTI